jgi:hypothetical protein
MKTRLLIIIGIVLASVVTGSVYAASIQIRCEDLLGDTKYPRPLTFWNCLDYLQRVDNPPPKTTAVPELESEPTPNDTVGKRIKVEGEIAEQICEIMGGGCPSYYIGNIQDDGSIMVGITISQPSGETFHLFFINDGVLSHEVRENEN